jgi:hypothetical protein
MAIVNTKTNAPMLMVKLSLDNTNPETAAVVVAAVTVWVVLRRWAATCLLNHKECLPQ